MTQPAPGGRFVEHPDRLAQLFCWWVGILSRHRLLLTVLLALGGLVFGPLSSRIRWEADVLLFFSSDSQEVANIRRSAGTHGMANQLRLDVHAAAGAALDRAALRRAAHELADRLRQTGRFRDVWDGVSQQQLISSYAQAMQEAPTLLDAAMLQTMRERLDSQYLSSRFSSAAARAIDPDGEMLLRQIQHDPLDITGLVAGRMRDMGSVGNATLEEGMLVSGDGGHIMLVAEPGCLPSDQKGTQAVIAAIERAVAEVAARHAGVQVWTIGAHRAYAENAGRVVRDVGIISLIGTVAVALSIALFFRRWAPALICVIPPSVGVGVTLGLFGLGRADLPLIILGFGGLICGYTTDYGIQIIAACRRRLAISGNWDTNIPALAARELLGPVSMSAATTVTGFLVLMFSNSSGLRSMGLFVAIATLCIWGVTFLILPAYLGPWVVGRSGERRPVSASWFRRNRWVRLGAGLVFAIVTLWLAGQAMIVRFNPASARLDGSSAAMREQEKQFAAAWGDFSGRSILLLRHDDPEALLAQLHHVDSALAQQQADGMIQSFYSPACLLPDGITGQKRLAAWSEFWTPQRREAARKLVEEAARSAGLKPAAWQSWLDGLEKRPEQRPASRRLADCPLGLFPGVLSPDHAQVAVVVQMRRDVSPRLMTAWANELRLQFDDLAIISGHALIFDANERARADMENLGPLAILAILLTLWLFFRRITAMAAASISMFLGFVWVLGTAQAFLGGLNLLCLVPILFVLGVAIDYGIYTASDPALRTGTSGGDRLGATMLCALTTILGSGSLALASHPVLRWLGVTLVAGVLGGYLAAVLVVAPLTRWLHRPKRAGWLPATLRVTGRVALASPVLLLALLPWWQWRLSHIVPPFTKPVPQPPVIQTGDSAWHVGKAWMRRRDGIWEMYATGSPEEIGYGCSRLGAPIDLRIENEMLDQMDTMLPSLWSRWLLTRAVAVNFLSLPDYIPPAVQREIGASALGYRDPYAYMAPTYPRLLGYHALHDVSQMLIDNPLLVNASAACTGVIASPGFSGDGHLWLARNFDFEAGQTFSRHKSVTYCVPDEGIPFVSVAWPGLSGSVTGMNKQRLALFINAGATRDFRRIGTPTIILARQVLQHARDIEEALAIIRSTTVFVSDILVLADGKSGQAVVVEKSPATTAVWPVSESAVVANHFVSPPFQNDSVNRDRIQRGTSQQRFDRASELLKRINGKVDQHTLAALLRDNKGLGDKEIGLGNRNAIDGLIACHGVIMDVTAGRMWVAAWPCVEGTFVYVDAMRMLGESPADFQHDPGMNVPADPVMTDGRWDRFLVSRGAWKLSAAALDRKDGATAAARARQAIKANPDFYYGHELLGRAMLMRDDKAAAKVSLQRALALDPPYAERRTSIEEFLRQCSKPD